MSEPSSPEAPSASQSIPAQSTPEPVAPQRGGFNPVAAGFLGVFVGLIAGIAIGTQSAPKPRERIVINVQIQGQTAQIIGEPVNGNPLEGARYVLGQKNARVTMVEFGDYGCGYCRLYTLETFPKLKAEFVDTGKVQYAYRDTVSVGGEYTVRAAKIGNCVARENFWQYHEAVFERRAEWSQNATEQAETLFKGIAQNASSGAKTSDEFGTCAASSDTEADIQRDIAAASSFGITGTPSFIINGYMFSGALPLEVYREIFKKFGVS
jgi:protein-disulfide isomerase